MSSALLQALPSHALMNYESGSLLENVVRSSVDGILAFDLECRYLLWSPGMERIAGVPASRVLGRRAFEVFPFLLDTGEDEYFRRALRGETAASFARPFRVPETGREGIFEGFYSPLRDAAGTVVGGVAIIRDVTERVRLERDRAELAREQVARKEAERVGELLRESEERYRAFVSQSAEGIWRFELDEPVPVDLPIEEQLVRYFRDGYLGECNDAMARMYGYGRADELVGARLGELLIPSDPANEAFLRAFVEAGYRLEDAESHEVDRAGGEKYFLNNLMGVIEGGRMVRAWGTQRDITERRRNESEREALLASERRARSEAEGAVRLHREVEERLSVLVDASALLLGAVRLEDVQPAILELARRLVAADAYAVWRREHSATRWDWHIVSAFGVSNAYLRQTVEDGDQSARLLVEPFMCADVRAEPVLRHRQLALEAEGVEAILAVPLRLHGELAGSIAFYYRTTHAFTESEVRVATALSNLAGVAIGNAQLYEEQSRLRAEAEDANRLKDDFLATMSHELRTPLNAIIGWTRLLQAGSLDDGARLRALETIDRNARAQAQIVGDLLDVSRIITGKLRLDVRVVEIRGVLDAAIDAVRPAADARGIRLAIHVEADIGPVAVDPDRLQQVVWNLLTNAVKFTHKGGLVEVRAERVESSVAVSVADSGDGIAPEFLPHVFERFRQADASTTRQHGGLGLGLAIVRQLVEMHGGSVGAESGGPGLGSRFTVTIPLAALRSLNANESSPGHAGAAADLDVTVALVGVRVLVVDDTADTRDIVSRVLGDSGAEVVAVASARDALETMQQFRPDVILSDLGMPVDDGYDLIAAVRALPAAEGGRTPAIALTAYAHSEDRVKALAAGFQMHLPKPVDPVELALVVSSVAKWRER
jgi:PAS domain S-box-containing protein